MSPELLRRWSLAAALASSLVACGGGGAAGTAPPPPPPPPPPPGARGDLLSFSTLGAFQPADINAQTAIDHALVNDTAHCGVTVVSLSYSTIDPAGTATTAGAGLLIPDESNCPGPHPMLSHQHGTTVDASFDTASTQANSTSAMMAALYASHGYVVVMPNYLGYAGSTTGWHAYLQAEPSAAVVIDAVRAARNYFKAHSKSTKLSTELYLSGTSQGGYVTLATQRVMERDFPGEFTLTKVAPTSGPYDVATTFHSFMAVPDDPSNPNTTPAAFTLYGYQRTYGDVYSDPIQVFNSDWAGEFTDSRSVSALIPGVYPSDTAIRQACKLPWNVKDLGGVHIGSCSNAPLLQASFVSDFLTERVGSHGLAALVHARADSLVHASGLQPWSPHAPITFCYGDIDPMATPNAIEATHLDNSTVIDVQTDPSEPAYIRNWMIAGAGNNLYHGQVEGPGCTSYAKNVIFPRLY
jgi:hypothetical protein